MPSNRANAKAPEAQATISSSNPKRVFREIDITRLREPARPARETMDEEKLGELIVSIQRIGIIEPLIVFPVGENFEVMAGHRRLVSAQAAGLAKVPCIIYLDDEDLKSAVMHHENKCREELNVAEEAKHFHYLLKMECEDDVDKLVELVHESRDYVERRLLIAQGDPKVFECLASRQINLGVAEEFNRVNDPARRLMYLDAAVKGGCTIPMARQWRVQGNALDAQTGNIQLPPPGVPPGVIEQTRDTRARCILCNSPEDQHEMEIRFIHRSCERVAQRREESDHESTPSD